MSGLEDRVFDAIVQRVAARTYVDDMPASRLPVLEPASAAAVAQAEELAGRGLPPLLRRLYLEVGDGGFGPGYGLFGLDKATRGIAGGFLNLCDWGCGITSELDLRDGQVWGSDPNPAPDDVEWSFPQGMTIVEWFAKWVDGRLHQPWLLQDPESGLWRGATDEETAAMLEEAFGPAD
ncbi:hypothetical protein [Dactylosporangium darangshiense]|uniref:Knr4/Smi1-like domain-containing protein n=1 Tax=Dactylosporangium darangshiense TaxID=579108 RepID=A0ABP8DKK6_9ACTN